MSCIPSHPKQVLSEADEDKAIEALDGAEWMERSLKVNKAIPREDRSSSGGGRRNNRF